MTPLLAIAAIVVAGIAALVVRGNRSAARAHARFQAADVEEALVEVLSPQSERHDRWDLFLSWRIDDPFLESIRQQCLRIVAADTAPAGQDLSADAMRRVGALLEELRSRARAAPR